MQTTEFEATKKSGLAHKKIKWRNVSWLAILLCMTAIVFVPSLYIPLTWLMVPFVGILFFYDDFYTLCGMFLFFEENLVLIPGLALFAVYSMLVIVKYFLFDKAEKKIPVLIIPAVCIMLMYAIFAMPTADTTAARLTYINSGRVPPSDAMINMRLIIGYMLDSAVIIILALRISHDDKLKNQLCPVIVCSAVLSGIYGYVAGNIFNYGAEGNTIVRYMASFNDPNYASFFFNFAIFIVLTNGMFKKLYVKIPLMIVLYYFLVASGSMSGLIFNILGIIIFTIFKYRVKMVLGLLIAAIIGGGVVFMIMKIPKLANLPVIVNLETRISRQFLDNEDINMSDATSGRETQWEVYWDYFKRQELENKLFGGNIIMSYSIDQNLKEKYGNPPHQAYLSFILDFGLVGGVIMILFFVIKLINTFVVMCRTESSMNLLLFLIACMWLFYGMGFDYFGDWRFMIFYFL